jgi:hypothetical protein
MAAIATVIAFAIPITICCGAAIRSPLLRIAWCHLLPFSHTRPVSPYPCTSLPPRQTAGSSSSQILHTSIPSLPTPGERQQGQGRATDTALSHATPRTHPNIISYPACLRPRPRRSSHQTTSNIRVPVACSYILCTTLPPAPADVPAMCTDANRMEAMALVQPQPGPASMCSPCHMHEWTKPVVSSAYP